MIARWLAGAVGLLVAGVVVGSLPSCSLLLASRDCEDNSDCSAGAACSADGLCVAMVTEQCDYAIGEVGDPGSVTLGALMPTVGGNRDSGIYVRQAIELAVNQINSAGGVGGLQERNLAVLVCNDGGDAELGKEGARHLVDTVGVPAIIGPGFSRVLIDVAEEVTIPAGVVLVSHSATAVEIRGLEDDDLVWRTAPPDTFQGDTIAYFSTYPLLLAAQSSASPDVTVALVFAEDAYGRGLATHYRSQLSAYLLPLSGQLVPSFPEVPYDSTDPSSVAEVATRISELSPDVVILVGYEEAADILGSVSQIANLQDVAWFVPDGVRTEALRIAFSQESDKPEFLFGTAPSSRTDSVVFQAFSDEYLSEYGQGLVAEPQTWTEHAYDATYLLAFALASVDGEPTGQQVAAGLSRLSDPEGSAVSVGRDFLVSATTVMGQGGTLLVHGASGTASFDPTTGDPQNADILRWDLRSEGPGNWVYEDCGTASSYSAEQPLGSPDWCAALCASSAGDDDDSAGSDEEPCKPDGVP
ncbi:MAG TPA: hypothetical protein DIU15_10700 [Deltaproteobacteria bacterium]|nr:hypothetical protein [Deltaproteobacteria bacterium]HCP46505.1 hypothetical protein [Deltaproteobacteria bacterium]